MPELMNHVDFRTALENAIKGKSANKAPFSIAWASGKLSRQHLARWAENHYHYVGPFADYLAYVYGRMPDRFTEAKDFLLANMYEEEIGGDRHTDLLIRFAEACGTTRTRVTDPDNMSATTRGLQSWCYAVAMREDPIVAVAPDRVDLLLGWSYVDLGPMSVGTPSFFLLEQEGPLTHIPA